MRLTDTQLARISKAQNHVYNRTQDIITFTAFFETHEEVEAHIARYEQYAREFDALTPKQQKLVTKKYYSIAEALRA